MKADAIAFGIAGVFFGLIAGWIIGSQQASLRPAGAVPTQQAAAQGTPSSAAPTTRAAVLNENEVTALKSVADREKSNARPRLQLRRREVLDVRRIRLQVHDIEAVLLGQRLGPLNVILAPRVVVVEHGDLPQPALLCGIERRIGEVR
jgi:hypothetical protein